MTFLAPVNGDEVGLLYISEGKAHTFRNDIVSYQPPAADFAFDGDGLIYYTYAAPGFENMIVTIDSVGNVNELQKMSALQPALISKAGRYITQIMKKERFSC